MSNHIGRLLECARMGIRFHCDPEQVKEMAAECESALADQRRYRALVHSLYCDEAVHVGEAMVIFKVVGGCPTEQEFDAAMDELASIVPLDQEGE